MMPSHRVYSAGTVLHVSATRAHGLTHNHQKTLSKPSLLVGSTYSARAGDPCPQHSSQHAAKQRRLLPQGTPRYPGALHAHAAAHAASPLASPPPPLAAPYGVRRSKSGES